MTLNKFLTEAHKALDAATVADGLGDKGLCFMHLGKLHGLCLVFLERIERPQPQVCRVCGCTWVKACPGGCYWVKEDLCSACAHVT